MAGYWAPTIHLAVSAALSSDAPSSPPSISSASSPANANPELEGAVPGAVSREPPCASVGGGGEGVKGVEGGRGMRAAEGGEGGRMAMLVWALANAEALQVYARLWTYFFADFHGVCSHFSPASVYKVFLQKLIPAQIYQMILDYY